jgi:hypothetical protein
MNPERFDDLARTLSASPSRRQTFKLLGGFVLGSVGAVLGARTVQAAANKCEVGSPAKNGVCPENQQHCNITGLPDCCIPCGATHAENVCTSRGGSLSGCGCTGTLTRCGGKCVNLAADPRNCGSCGNVCPRSTPDCCATVSDPSRGTCVNKQTDKFNCGGCGRSCRPGEICFNGNCTCPQGETFCESAGDLFDRCVSPTAFENDANNCGACGRVCTEGAICVNRRCTCPASMTTCGVDANGEPIICCPTGQSCINGTCSGVIRCDCTAPARGEFPCPAGMCCFTGYPSQLCSSFSTCGPCPPGGSCRQENGFCGQD